MDVHNQHPSHGPSQVVVIVVPFTCQSHLNQLLQLSCLISSYNIPVHYACTALHIRQAKLRFNGINNLENTNLHFHEFPTPPFLSPPPNPNGSTKFPVHLQSSFEATVHLREPVAKLLHEISPTARRVIVIHDFLMCYVVQDTTTFPNVESYAFNPISAFTSFFEAWESQGKSSEVQVPEGLPSKEGCHTEDLIKFVTLQVEFMGNYVGIIYNSCRSIEGTYIDLWAAKENIKQIWAVGPLNLGTTHNSSNSKDQHKCLEWLDKQAPNSVLYISFGTTTSMTDEQIKELAVGLEQSEQKFIWVLREADKGDIFAGDDDKRAQLPEGYEERVKELGLLVRDWAPQLDILAHPSTGGFMSHCGWNSCIESITMGVPIAAWPMHSDQPRNAFLVTDVLKAGLVVNQWTRQEGLVTSSTIANAVKRLIASKEGEDIRKRAKELGSATRQSVKEGRKELDSFIAHITR